MSSTALGEPFDDVVHLLEDLGRVVGDERGMVGPEGRRTVPVPVRNPGPEEDPVDQGFLRRGLVVLDAGVAEMSHFCNLKLGLPGNAAGRSESTTGGDCILTVGRGRLGVPVAGGEPTARFAPEASWDQASQ